MLTSLSDCDSDWGEENDRLWAKHASQISAVIAELGLEPSVELLAHRHSPFLIELGIEKPTIVMRSGAAELSKRLRLYLQRVNSDWQIKVLIIPSIPSTLPEGVWLDIDRFWIVERLALYSAEHFESLEDFVSTYWTPSK